MTQTTVLHARVLPDLKANAEKVFKKLGITTTQAISMFLASVDREQGIPFEMKIPNAETRRAMRDAELGRNLSGPFYSVEELMADLNK